jgi:hypothetical protein
MSIHRRAARRDANEAEIIAALRAVGATVQQLSGEDVPDLLVGFRGVDYLVEVKMPLGPKGGASDRVLSEGQATWHAAWRGRPPVVVRAVEEALAAIGAVARPAPRDALCSERHHLGHRCRELLGHDGAHTAVTAIGVMQWATTKEAT